MTKSFRADFVPLPALVRYEEFSARYREPAAKQLEGEVLLDNPHYVRVDTRESTYLIPHRHILSIRIDHDPNTEESEQ
ncbi:hypothetical protein L5I01_17345 [Gordonia sp. HY442]|uniref:hypothetical protein n=1 Tax=Gordonia zhenghanii TaxID=2911516 RepID=UPI001F2A4BDD|nr:hypothetical protein [Gordonia zhenghanii]MCF8605122.1 hypothetical protein [Gordonia zhenghanii]